MTAEPQGRFGEYGRPAASAMAVAGLVGSIGYLPTLKVWGQTAIPAMWMGCGISLAAGLLGGIAIGLSRGRARDHTLAAAGAAMGLRFVAAVALGAAVAMSGWFERGPLLIWIAASYLALLAVETRYALRVARKHP